MTFVLADGLSARAVHEHGAALLAGTLAHLPDTTVGTPVLARQARVAIGDEIALLTGARLVVVLIGERPGLSLREQPGRLHHLRAPTRISRLPTKLHLQRATRRRPAGGRRLDPACPSHPNLTDTADLSRKSGASS